MGISLQDFIKNDSAVKLGGFSGGVFLTYTLNLGFYEQIVASWMDQAGCANVLILADPDGYTGAIDMGTRPIKTVGLRYVCAPLERKARGVHHAKLLLMAGPRIGRLLIGSGNLTMHGYGRNLELFSAFEYDDQQDSPENRYPFCEIWNLLKRIKQTNQFPTVVEAQLELLREKAPWLEQPCIAPEGLRIWHNFDTPIWENVRAWRRENGYEGYPIRVFQVISPYYDKNTNALQSLVDEVCPDKTEVYLDPKSTNLDGSKLQRSLVEKKHNYQVSGVQGETDKRLTRHLHAKAIIGIER